MQGNHWGRRVGGAAALFVAFGVGLLWGSTGGSSAEQDTARVFNSHTGLVFNYVTPGQGPAFESAMIRVSEALAVSEDLERRLQGASWKLYRAEESLDGEVLLYISVLSPVVSGADYWVPDILNEAFPTEVQELYQAYAGAFSDGQILMNLSPVWAP